MPPSMTPFDVVRELEPKVLEILGPSFRLSYSIGADCLVLEDRLGTIGILSRGEIDSGVYTALFSARCKAVLAGKLSGNTGWPTGYAAPRALAGFQAIRSAAAAADEIAALKAQLPQGMKHCTIVFKECEKGHGWLTATNWVQHDCPTCVAATLKAKLAVTEERLAGVKAEVARLTSDNLSWAIELAKARIARRGAEAREAALLPPKPPTDGQSLTRAISRSRPSFERR